MVIKLIFAICLTIAIFQYSVIGAPTPFNNENEMVKSFANFLRQDKDLTNILQEAKQLENSEFLMREKRDTEENDMVDEQNVEVNKEGFFDKAAKFVMEILQRFLKWINTDD